MEGDVLHRPSIDTLRENSLQARLQSFRRNSIRFGLSRHFFFRRLPPPGSQAAKAFAFTARSVRIDICCIQRNVAEPRPDRVDINAGSD